MDVKESEAQGRHAGRDDDAKPYSAEWWEQRSTVELREIIKRGFALGQAFDGAVAETERRAREATRRVRDEAGVEVQRKAKNRLLILGGILAALILIVIAAWLTN